MILVAIDQLAPLVGRRQACHVLAVPRATWYRHRRPPQVRHRGKPHPRALRAEERTRILACLHEERFQDCAPRQVYAALLDEGGPPADTGTLGAIVARHRRRSARAMLRATASAVLVAAVSLAAGRSLPGRRPLRRAGCTDGPRRGIRRT